MAWTPQIVNRAPVVFAGVSGTDYRLYRWNTSFGVSAPSAGGYVDAVAAGGSFYPATPGQPALIEAHDGFSAGVNLKVSSTGRVLQATAGTIIVARALEGGVAGDLVWCVFETQRTA